MRKRNLLFLCLLFVSFHVLARVNAVVQNGILDLRNYNWQRDGIADIKGTWEFYREKLLPPEYFQHGGNEVKEYTYVPSFWSDYQDDLHNIHDGLGYGTYHVVVLCPPSREQLALKFLTVESAYRLFVNGKELLSVGHPDTTAGATIPELHPAVINVTPDHNRLDIVVQVSNFHNRYGGLWDTVKIGTIQQVRSSLILNISWEMIVTGCLFISFVYYLILFISFHRRYVLLFFSIVCLIMCVRTLVMGEMPILYISNGGWELGRRLEYFSLYAAVPSFSLFSYFLFPKDFSRTVLYTIIPISAVFVLLSCFFPYYVFTYPVRYFEGILLLVAFYGLSVYIRAVLNKRPGSVVFLTGFCIFLLTIINDILYVNLIIHTVPLFYIGLLFFVISLSVLISRQFARTFSELQLANSKLLNANEELAMMNKAVQEKNMELKKINHELDSLVNRTSHDLRGPLRSVLGIIKVAHGESKVDNVKSYLTVQEKTLNRMNSLINDIIDFSKNKRLHLDLKEIDFYKLVNDALEDHSYMMNAQKIKKETEIKQFEKFISDPRRISVIINNLVSNAIKYADNKKDVQKISINILVANGMTMIEVTDNGIGIEEQSLNDIFTLFYRSTSSANGSGLGLYIIKETVEKLGGYININSKKDEGTTIKINIPDMGYQL